MAETDKFFIVEADDLSKWSGAEGSSKSEAEAMMQGLDGAEHLVVIKGRVTGPVFKAE